MVPISMPFVLKFSIFVVIICVCVEFQDVSAGKGMVDCMIDHDYDGEYFLLCFCEATSGRPGTAPHARTLGPSTVPDRYAAMITPTEPE